MPFSPSDDNNETNGESLSMFSCTPADNEIAGYPTCLCCQLRLASATRRISRDLSRRGFISKGGASLASLGLFSSAGARAAPANFTSPIVFTNFMLFDGKSKSLRGGLGFELMAIVSSGSPAMT